MSTSLAPVAQVPISWNDSSGILAVITPTSPALCRCTVISPFSHNGLTITGMLLFVIQEISFVDSFGRELIWVFWCNYTSAWIVWFVIDSYEGFTQEKSPGWIKFCCCCFSMRGDDCKCNVCNSESIRISFLCHWKKWKWHKQTTK